MSVEIITRPQQTVNADIPQTSRWGSAHQPTIFEFQRRDHIVDTIAENTGSDGGIEIVIDSDMTGELVVGEQIYLNDGVNYEGWFDVIDFYAQTSPEQTVIIVDAPLYTGSFGSPTDGFVNINRTGYFIEVKILEYTSGTPVEISDEYARFTSDSEGLIVADLQSWLKTLVTAENENDYLTTTFRAENIGQPYNIQFREYWKTNGFNEWSTLSDDNLHYTINGVKQIGELYGQNFGEYVMFPPDTSSPITEGNRGLFLTMFEQPKYFVGFPFDLSFIYSQEYADSDQDLIKIEEVTDINETFSSETNTAIEENGGYVNRVMLEGDYLDSDKYINVTLRNVGDECTPSGNNLILNGDFADNNPVSPTFYWQRQDGVGNTMVDDYTNNRCELTGVNASEGSACYIFNEEPAFDDTQTFDFSIEIGQLLQVSVTYKSHVLMYLINSDASKMVAIRFDRRNVGSNGIWLLQNFDTGDLFKIVTTDTIYGTWNFSIPTSYWHTNSSGLTSGFWFRAVGSNNGWDDIYFDLADAQECNLVNPEQVESDYYDYSGASAISETKTIEIDGVCVENPIQLCWINPLGGFDYWVFHTAQDISDNISNERTFEQYIADIGTATGRKKTLSKEVRTEIQLGAEHLTVQQMEGLRHLFASPNVMMFDSYNDDGSPKWVTVGVNTGTFIVQKTDENKMNVTFKIILPERYLQTQ